MIIQDSLFESLESLALELCAAWDDWVTSCFELVIVDHQVTGKNETNLALAPSSVDIAEVLAGNAASFEVLRVPGGDTLGHGTLDETVGSIAVGELEVKGLAEWCCVHVVALVAS